MPPSEGSERLLHELSTTKALEKTGALLYAISKFAEVPGKKALQKIQLL